MIYNHNFAIFEAINNIDIRQNSNDDYENPIIIESIYITYKSDQLLK